MSHPTTFRAQVLHTPGPASTAFTLETRPIPTTIPPTHVLVRVLAFGLNHSELCTRLAIPTPMPPVSLPRTLGIELVGAVASDPTAALPAGTVVLAALGGLGRAFDGAYAELCLVPRAIAIPVASAAAALRVPLSKLAALPVALQTAYGCVVRQAKVGPGEAVLVRGGTSAVGQWCVALAKRAGAKTVVASTRREGMREVLTAAGADAVVVEAAGKVGALVREVVPAGVDKVIELVGAATMLDSMGALAEGGVCVVAGTLGGQFKLDGFLPLIHVPMGRYLMGYAEMTFKEENTPWKELLGEIADGKLRAPTPKTFEGLEKVGEAHELLESSKQGGKIVVVV